MHFPGHATPVSYGRHVLCAQASDFIGSPPLAFTFGGRLVLFPLRSRLSILRKRRLRMICLRHRQFGATISFTLRRPIAMWKACRARHHNAAQIVSAGEACEAAFEAWLAAKPASRFGWIGATEMPHIFIGSPERNSPGLPAKPVLGMRRVSSTTTGHHSAQYHWAPSVRGRRMSLSRGQAPAQYVPRLEHHRRHLSPGCRRLFLYQARSDDMIVSSGYNIRPEVEARACAPRGRRCGVVGAPHEERGQIVKAYIVLAAGLCRGRNFDQDPAGPRQGNHRSVQISARDRLRGHIARTQTGKLQRFELRRMAGEAPSHKLAS